MLLCNQVNKHTPISFVMLLCCFKFVPIFCFIFLFNWSFGLKCGIMNRERRFFVKDGNPLSNRGLYPWLINLRIKSQPNKVYCTGVAISKTLILAAAHCFRNEKGRFIKRTSLWIHYLSHNVSKVTDGDFKVPVRRYFIHPRNYQKIYSFDLAIIQVLYPIANLMPICLPCFAHMENINWKPFEPESNEKCLIAGWGYTSASKGSLSSIPLQAQLPVMTVSECEKYWPMYELDSSMICAGKPSGSMPCPGDSGVPLMCQRNGYWFVSGLVSWGSAICGDKPTIFSNIAKMRNWIAYALKRVGESSYCRMDSRTTPGTLEYRKRLP